MKYRVSSAAYSSQGKVRTNNEDSFVLFKKLCEPPEQTLSQSLSLESNSYFQWYGVFDGMGGEESGEIASFAAAEMFHQKGGMFCAGSAARQFPRLVDKLNEAVVRKLNGADGGCTMAAAFICGKRLYAVHVGDSRVYLFRGKELTRLTSDHTPADQVYYRGKGRKSQKIVRRSHMLYRYLGETVRPVICDVSQAIRLCEGDRILICSDGLSDMVEDRRIFSRLCQMEPPDVTARMLHDDAMESGGIDNTTVLMIDIH